MSNQHIYDTISLETSKGITKAYSTSFSLGILLLSKQIRDAIYSIYGFVRVADEIVDTFHAYDKRKLLTDFEEATWQAIDNGISVNPVLHTFQKVVNTYNIDKELIKSFLNSMYMDLTPQTYDKEKYDQYIFGSAEVVGLFCLKVFCLGDEKSYQILKPSALKLGAAFQKVNFLRDLQADYCLLGRTYFPQIDFNCFDEKAKKDIEQDIENDFKIALEGIRNLPLNSRMGVYLSYIYYRKLFETIKNTPCQKVMQIRIRVSNYEKACLLLKSYKNYYFNLI